jgi:hypothetical protein
VEGGHLAVMKVARAVRKQEDMRCAQAGRERTYVRTFSKRRYRVGSDPLEAFF